MESKSSLFSAAVILQYASGVLYVTLTSHNTPDASIAWRLPSTPVFPSHTSLSSLSYALGQTIGLQDTDISYKEQLYTTETIRESQSHTTICYLYLSRGMKWHKGTQQVGVFPITKLPKLSQEDKAIVRYALDRFHAKTLYSTIVGFILPEVFDLTQLQQAFETVTQQSVDRRNFRKKILSLGVLMPHSPEQTKSSPTTPTRYRLKSSQLTLFDTPFRMQSAKPEATLKASKNQSR